MLLIAEHQAAKLLELASQLFPDGKRFGLLVNALHDEHSQVVEIEAAAATLAVAVVTATVRGPDELPAAFGRLAGDQISALIIPMDPMSFSERRQIATLAEAARLPIIGAFREIADEGGLASYGTDLKESMHRAAYFVDKILKGVPPGEIPIEFPRKLDLIVNLKSAKALDLAISPTLLARTDEVIE